MKKVKESIGENHKEKLNELKHLSNLRKRNEQRFIK